MKMTLVALLFIILGIAVKYGKMYFLIAGYNTMSANEKEKYDVEGVASVFRNAMFGMAFILIVGILLNWWLNNPSIEKYSMYAAALIGIPYLLIKSNAKEFKIDNHKTKSKEKS